MRTAKPLREASLTWNFVRFDLSMPYPPRSGTVLMDHAASRVRVFSRGFVTGALSWCASVNAMATHCSIIDAKYRTRSSRMAE